MLKKIVLFGIFAFLLIPMVFSVTDVLMTSGATSNQNLILGQIITFNASNSQYNNIMVDFWPGVETTVQRCFMIKVIGGVVLQNKTISGGSTAPNCDFSSVIVNVSDGPMWVGLGQPTSTTYVQKYQGSVSYPKVGANLNFTNGTYYYAGGTLTSYATTIYMNVKSVNSTAYTAPAGNSCTYSTGDWTINVADQCNITSTVTMSASSTLTINGSATSNAHRLNITAGSIKGFSTVKWIGLNTTIWGAIG